MPNIKRDDGNMPVPQYLNDAGTAFETVKGKNGAPLAYIKDGASEALGARADAETDGDGSLISITKRIRSQLGEALTNIDSLEGKDFATEATLLAIKGYVDQIESYIDGIEGSLSALVGKDFATQTTLAAVLAKLSADPASQTTLAAILAKLSSDPATQTGINSLITLITAIRDTAGIKRIVDAVDVSDRLARILGKVTVDDGGLATLGAKADVAVIDPATAATIIQLAKGLLKQLQGTGSGSQPVTVTNSKLSATTATVTGVKTITGTAALLFAGASPKAGRRELGLRNPNPALPIRIGRFDVTDQTGKIVEPGAEWAEDIDPGSNVEYYAISPAGAVAVEVWES